MHLLHIRQKDALLEQTPPLMEGRLTSLAIIVATNNNYAPAASLFSDLGLPGVEALLGGALRANMMGFCCGADPTPNQKRRAEVQS